MTDELPKRKQLRIRGHDYSIWQYYFITICTHNKRKLFNEKIRNDLLIGLLKEYSEKYKVSLDTWCIMPNHLHLIIHPEGERSISEFINAIKSKFTKEVRKSGFDGNIWQRSYYDHILRNDEDVESRIIYILMNPERAGIVTEFDQYEYSGDAFRIKEERIKTREP
jgi:putative transposase